MAVERLIMQFQGCHGDEVNGGARNVNAWFCIRRKRISLVAASAAADIEEFVNELSASFALQHSPSEASSSKASPEISRAL
jgi:hypothetical protein